MSTDHSFISTSTFNYENANIKSLLHPIHFHIIQRNDSVQPFCHYTHKNLKWKQAPFNSQDFMITFKELINVKNICIQNFTHGSQMTISVGQTIGGELVQVYEQKYICKGKSLKGELKQIDLGALPCQVIQISVTKGSKISSKNIGIVGVESNQIEEKLGAEYFKLMVINPLKIMYTV